MPYELQKSGKKYFVVNKITGQKYSKKPLSKVMAERQLTALRIHANDDIQGAGLADMLKTAYSKTKNLIGNITGRVQGVISGRNDYPPKVRYDVDIRKIIPKIIDIIQNGLNLKVIYFLLKLNVLGIILK